MGIYVMRNIYIYHICIFYIYNTHIYDTYIYISHEKGSFSLMVHQLQNNETFWTLCCSDVYVYTHTVGTGVSTACMWEWEIDIFGSAGPLTGLECHHMDFQWPYGLYLPSPSARVSPYLAFYMGSGDPNSCSQGKPFADWHLSLVLALLKFKMI